MVKGWETTTIGTIATFEGGSQPPFTAFINQPKSGYIRLIQIRDYKTDKYQTFIPLNLAKRFCTTDDIMIGRYGPPIFQILRGIEGAYNVALIKTIPKDVDKEFLYYTLTRKDLFDFIELLSRRSSGQTGVDLQNLREFEIVLPPPSEQHAIATALSDADAYIAALEKLIAKKRSIKQGAMHELLTGKRRLPGFSGEWDLRQLGEIGWLLKESVNPQLSPTNAFVEYSMPAYDNGRLPQHVLGKSMHSNRLRITSNVLLVNKLNVRQQRIWIITSCPENAVCSAEFLPYYSNMVSLGFLQQLFLTDRVILDFEGMSTGTSNSQKRITPDNYLQYQVLLPPTLAEQSAIAAVFSDMDAEIDGLTAKLNKAKQIKQSMINELLTGRIRLL